MRVLYAFNVGCPTSFDFDYDASMVNADTSAPTPPEGFGIAPGSRIVFAGDSITDSGRTEGRGGALGEGFVAEIARLLPARWPDMNAEIISTGISGFNSRDLLARWRDDVLAHEPDWVSLLVGINDCRQCMFHDDRGVSPAEYASNCRELVSLTLAQGSQMVLVDPFWMFEPGGLDDATRSVLAELDAYIATIATLAEEFGLVRVRAHELFARQLEHRPLVAVGPDRVHPTVAGHTVLALGWLTALGW